MNPIPTELLEAQSIAIDTLTRLMQGRPLAADEPFPSNQDATPDLTRDLTPDLTPEDHKRRETARRSATDLLRIITRFHLAKPHSSNTQRNNHTNSFDSHADLTDPHDDASEPHNDLDDITTQRRRRSNSQRKTERPPPRPFSVPLPSPWPADLSSLERSPIPQGQVP